MRAEDFSASQPGTPCPSVETVLAYVEGLSGDDVDQIIPMHLATCDGCLDIVIAASRRLDRISTLAIPVPLTLMSRSEAHLPAAAWPAATPVPFPRRVTSRLPISGAITAVFLLCLTVVWQWRSAGIPQPRSTRGIVGSQTLRVTTLQAAIYADPHLHAPMIGKLARGAQVEIHGEERGWYRVTTSSGARGWMEQHAFE